MRVETEKLLKAIEKSVIVKEGNVAINKDGVKYRYDHYKNKYKNTPYWLKQIFDAAAQASGKRYSRTFQDDEYSFYFERAKFKGSRDGNISYSKLVKL